MVLLVAGVIFGAPWFVFAFFFGVLPMVRMLLPDDLAEPAEIGRISRMQFIFLKSIPLAHALMWALVLPWAMFVVSQLQPAQLACFALSFWVVTSLNLTIAHELLHRPVGWQRIAARLLAGSIGYFQMLEEHRSHHVNVGGRDNGDSPEVDESIFTYAIQADDGPPARRMACGRRQPAASAQAAVRESGRVFQKLSNCRDHHV